MRVIGGKFKGLKLMPPNDLGIRPTSDRLKEALFSILESKKYNININNSSVIDICSGTGALGIEALSRGANKIYFIDQETKSIQIIQKNISKLKINNEDKIFIKVIKDKSTKALKKINHVFDIVLIDPPYKTKIIEETLQDLKNYNLIKTHSYIFAESSNAEIIDFNGYELLDTKKYGKSKLTILKLINSSSIE
ncbi:16S rRNA (guanine(966)-N(2))-methyltransferase RsmD [Alphaproteobacteria bacterium]|jgi:16S rRNA (guanine966-N2)-methyltransferase|nr:16S rRNA (guanine(966)-N(2))-methyltransferase RsmD [Alphaproteobacteria bacterium]MDA9165507.1 16S rRNA (guanine(966)-N(2))-methyltransferase RsmD [Alphaproteobacteria bacterium]